MTLLDRYIARQYLANIFLLFVLLFAVVVVIDFSLNFDEFSDIAERLVKEWQWPDTAAHRTLLAVSLVLDLWWPRLFQLFYYLLGFVLVGAMGFTAAQFVRHREFVAILAGGISLRRVARPMLLVACVMSALQLADSEIALPKLAPLLTREKVDAGRHSMGAARVPLGVDDRNRLFYAKSFDPDSGRIEGLWVWERDEHGLMTRRITATSATWEKGAWRLVDGRGEARRSSAAGHRDIRAIETLETDLDPTALTLRRYEGYSSNLSLMQIGGMLDRYHAAPHSPAHRVEQLERIRTGRFATIACNLLTLLICMPFFIRREPANMVVQSLYCAPVAICALIAGLLGASITLPGLPPSISPLVPVMVLIPIAIAAISGVKT
ncbi:MAG: LptF/LptG family permease [Phycisphaerales bacterium]